MVAASTIALFMGAWNLINVTRTEGDTEIPETLFGAQPAGMITYSPDGYMSSCLQTTELLSQTILGDDHPDLSEVLAVSYTGPFTINRTFSMPDARHGQVLHGPLVSTNLPGLVGATFARQFAFSEDGQYLTLSAENPGLLKRNLLWQKATKHDP